MSQVLEFQNEKISVSAAKNPGCKIVMDISVMPQMAKEAYDKAFKTIKKSVSVPGFRKGKAPDATIKQSYQKYVDSEWRDNLSKLALNEAFALSNMRPYNPRRQVEIKVEEISLEQPSKIQASYETFPQVPEISLQDIDFKEEAALPVTDEDVEQRIEGLLLFYADWTDVETRGAEEGDYIDLDIVSAENPSLEFCRNQRFLIQKKKMPQWIYKLLLGMKVGDEVEAESERDDSLSQDVEFKPMLCKITVKGIKNAVLPPLDDAFAEKVGTKDVEDLKVNVRKELETAAATEAKEALEASIEASLLEKHAFDVPQSLVYDEALSRYRKERARLESANTPAAEKEARLKQYFAKVDQEAQEALKLHFLFNAIAEKYALKVEEMDILTWLMNSGLLGQAQGDFEELKTRAYANVLRNKVFDLIKQNRQTRVE